MKEREKLVGIVYAYDTKDEYDMVRELGIEWIRLNICFPWKDKMYGQLSETYIEIKKQFTEAYKHGMRIMPATPPLGGFVFDKDLGKTIWKEEFPDFVGERGSEEFYKNVEKAMEFICKDLGKMAADMWQCMNEIDLPTFSNDYSLDILAETARASARGILAGNPKARCGINISHFYEKGLLTADAVYTPGHPFYYIGVDQYFGSWQGETVEKWIFVIDELYKRYKLPVLANEWGYSSGGSVTDQHPLPEEIPEGWADVCAANHWFHDVPGGHTPETQGEYLRRGHEIFAKHPHVIGSFMFCWRDAHHCYHCGKSECPSECFWGIVDIDCKPKKSYFTVKKAIADYY